MATEDDLHPDTRQEDSAFKSFPKKESSQWLCIGHQDVPGFDDRETPRLQPLHLGRMIGDERENCTGCSHISCRAFNCRKTSGERDSS